MKKHLRIMGCYFRLNLASAMEYRASFISQAFGMALSNSSFIFFWWVAFSQIGGTIGGYAFDDVLFIWAAASSGFGLAHILFANASNITGLIVTGELDAFLLQPCNVLLNVLCARTSLAAYGDFVYGFILMAIAYTTNLSAWLWFLFSVALGGLLLTGIRLFAHSLTFYMGDASMIANMATEFMINFSIYPEKIYAAPVRALMYSLLPAGVAIHMPLSLFKNPSPAYALVALLAAVLYSAFAGWFFYRGLRRYESGNAIVTRL